jgi:hypothetical protein
VLVGAVWWWNKFDSSYSERNSLSAPAISTRQKNQPTFSSTDKVASPTSTPSQSAGSAQTGMYSISDIERRGQAIPRPWLQGDLPFGPQIIEAARRAINGENQWALVLANLTDIPFSERSELRKTGKLTNYIEIPKEVNNDRFYWLKLAADRGDVLAQLKYTTEVASLKFYLGKRYDSIPQVELAAMQGDARRYLQAAMDAGLADAYAYASSFYRRAEIGLPFDLIKSHACLIILASQYSTPEVSQRLEFSAKELRSGELQQAIVLAQTPGACRVA